MKDQKQELIEIGTYLFEHQMLLGSSGNISIRNEQGFLISASGARLGTMSLEDITECREYNYDGKKPSKEVGLHQCIYEQREDIQCVIHCSPFYATLCCCSDIEVKHDLFVETMYYLQRIREVPFAYPGSEELEKHVRCVCKETNIVFLRHHGVLVYGETIQETLTTLEVLETCCKMNVLAYPHLRQLEEHSVKSFLNESGYKKRQEWK